MHLRTDSKPNSRLSKNVWKLLSKDLLAVLLRIQTVPHHSVSAAREVVSPNLSEAVEEVPKVLPFLP